MGVGSRRSPERCMCVRTKARKSVARSAAVKSSSSSTVCTNVPKVVPAATWARWATSASVVLDAAVEASGTDSVAIVPSVDEDGSSAPPRVLDVGRFHSRSGPLSRALIAMEIGRAVVLAFTAPGAAAMGLATVTPPAPASSPAASACR